MANVAEASVKANPDRRIEVLFVADVFKELGTRPGGLTEDEAQERLHQYGRNALQEIKGKPLYLKLIANFTHMMAILLWIGGIIAFVAKMPQLAIAIWMVNMINGAFSFWQEFKAEKATEALKKLLPSYARVIRDGHEQKIVSEELVPGDIILVAEGDHVSADARLVQEAELRVNQSTLNGESVPANRTSEAVRQTDLSRAEIPNFIFAGTSVAAGTGKAVVFATGMHTEFGKIANLTQSVGEKPSPLQVEMARVTKAVTVIAVVIGVLFFGLATLAARMSFAEGFIFAMGMIVAFIPEGMVPTVTLALAMGVQRMASRHALIKKLSSVETLGCCTVICTDKTGTLTQNEMTVRDLWAGGERYSVTGTGYASEGSIEKDGKAISAGADLRELLIAAGLCNDARLLPPNDESMRWAIIGDPTEAALIVAAAKGGVNLDAEGEKLPRIRELPFESRRKRMSTIHQRGSERLSFVKGAPKEILGLCKNMLLRGEERPLTEDLRAQAVGANDDFARNGLRVLAIAKRRIPNDLRDYTADTVENNLTLLGLMAMMDPPRPEVAAAVEKCHHAGIRIVMITGDYGLTAETIARRIGMIKGDHPNILNGVDLDGMSEDELRKALQDEVLFARVSPEHKMRVVSALQGMGHVVAVTGDGVNDAPALKRADIGVAMGIAGTDVAKEAANMILTDDNFASIVNAVEEGRAVYANIKKFISYIFTSNTPEAVPFIFFAFSAGRIPLALTVMQILFVDLGTDMVPALGLGSEKPEPGLMDKPPRSLKEHVITKSLLLRAYAFLGIIQSIAAMAAFYFMYWTNGHWGKWIDLPSTGWLYAAATAMTLAAVVSTQIGNVFAHRTGRSSIFKIGFFSNRMIWIGIATELALISLAVYAPFMHGIFGTAAFPLKNWLFLLAWAPSLLIADEMRKALLRFWARRTRKG